MADSNAVKSDPMSDLGAWLQSPPELNLLEGEIHLWRVHLDRAQPFLAQLQATLTPDERGRAKRYFFERDRNNFIAARGVLRDLLGKYLARAAREIEFEYGPRGKPSLPAMTFGSPIRFNAAHSHGLALFAFAQGHDLGVDVELVRPDFGGDEIAERYFAPQEVEELRLLSPSLHAEAFFLCWTRKEAYIKARGEGLGIPLDSFHVSLTPGQPERLHSTDSFRWKLVSLRPDPQYVGALVVEVGEWQIKLWDWKPGQN